VGCAESATWKGGELRKNTGENEVEKDEEKDRTRSEWEGVIEVQRRLARGRTR
jgi:hypothetical protein